ncbi:hypothetical protein CFB82_40400 [Burkholderia sp. HI2714]|uniref:hypothetical protein n=1 Tax=Burkholderia sp. HI2714 TaxID=2015359 RepID=UPI000B7AD057|nr:hypothetical protein [Burkholderia sp. HI2714]OXJ22519.1 hypothetical protein CFB82_40400 [Burkholderia sp. HI2714]
MVLRRSARLPTRVTASRPLLDALGQRVGAAPFTLAQCDRDARNPLALARLQDQLQAGGRDGLILPAIVPHTGPGGARGYRLAPDTWTTVQRPHSRSARAAQQAAREAAEQRERERALDRAKLRDAIALLERSPKGTSCGAYGTRVIGPDAEEQADG